MYCLLYYAQIWVGSYSFVDRTGPCQIQGAEIQNVPYHLPWEKRLSFTEAPIWFIQMIERCHISR
jgi:hypothetical protein